MVAFAVAALWAVGVAGASFALLVAGIMAVVQNGDGCTARDHAYMHDAPYRVFWLTSWVIAVGDFIGRIKPAPMRVAELSSAFMQSQVVFAINNLGIPDLLAAADAPQSAAELAAELATAGKNVPVAWLDRVLTAAASLGIVKRHKPSSRSLARARCHTSDDGASSPRCSTPVATVTVSLPAAKIIPLLHRDQLLPHQAACTYSRNAITAALGSMSPACMSSFVKLLEDDYAAMTHLSEGLAANTVPFVLWSGGQHFWEHLSSSERHAVTFDMAMKQKKPICGAALVKGYPFNRFDRVVDVAGGVGGFTSALLSQYSKLRGIVMDQEQQIARGKQMWQTYDPALSSRCELVAGNMFDSATIPVPAKGEHVAYLLNDILHNWDDSSAIAILRSIRGAVARSDGPASVKLLVLEGTKADEVLPWHLPFRCLQDVAMLTLFGDGKERDTQHFAALLDAAGWKFQRLVPTSGIFMVLEAVPAL